MAVLENRDLGQIMSSFSETSDIIASVGHVSGRVAMLKCQASNSILAVCSARETAESPQWEHSHTLLLWVPEVWCLGAEVPHSPGAFQKPFSLGAGRYLCQMASWLLAGQAIARAPAF